MDLSKIFSSIAAAFEHIFTAGKAELAPKLEGDALAFAHDLIDHYTPNNEAAALAKGLVEAGVENAQKYVDSVKKAAPTVQAAAAIARGDLRNATATPAPPNLQPPVETGSINGEHAE